MNINKSIKNNFHQIHSRASSADLSYYAKIFSGVISKYHHLHPKTTLRERTVLEVGCGGRAAGITSLIPLGPKSIQAIDANRMNVNLVRKLCAANHWSHVTVHHADALHLPFPDLHFDWVVSDGVIHHTTDPYRCFKEMTRVTQKGGFVFLGIYGYGGLWGRIIHPLGIALGKLLPYNLMLRFVNATGFMRSQNNSLIDWFYTPIQEKFNASEIYSWYQNNQFDMIEHITSPKWPYRLGLLSRLLFGDGYLFFIGRKKPTISQSRNPQ